MGELNEGGPKRGLRGPIKGGLVQLKSKWL